MSFNHYHFTRGIKLLFPIIVFLCLNKKSEAQQLNWTFNAGSSGNDLSYSVHTDNAGNVLIAGYFSGTADFDPSAATANLTSNGLADIFVAKYNAAGVYQWAFKIGGPNLDQALALTNDQNNNIIVTGFFRGNTVDFDPSAATANLSSNGDSGGDPGYGGDIFIAKYSPAGIYQWAFNMGGSQLYDSGITITTDNAGNIYTGGYFRETIDFDPSAAVNNLNSTLGVIYIAKYSATGVYQWAFNTGIGDNDSSPFDIKTDITGNVYVAGYFQGTNIDFDPSPATAILNSNGGFDAFFAKYNTNGQYIFAKKIGGGGTDVARGIELDNSGNIYLLGDFNGANIDFDPGVGTAPLSSNGAGDVFVAKYSNAGNYIRAFNFGGTAGDIGWKISTDNSHLFITGGFSGTADMNPSVAVDNLVSSGGNDIFLGKYNLDLEYLCAFKIGGSGNDYGFTIKAGGTNLFYLAGSFTGANIDFDPAATVFNLSTNGADDIFLARYTWPDNTLPNGTITGNTICPGDQAQLTFNATAGTGPFTLVFNDGTSNVTVTNIQSGVPFNVSPSPSVTTTYALVSIRDATRCSETRLMSGVTTTIVVNNCGSCNNWLNTPSFGSYVTVGDLDVTGNQLTVEVNYNSTALSSNGSWGHLVSKHTNTTNVNYAISPNGAEITTTNSGYTVAAQTCPILLNKTYHTAMVYDGTVLKFYRNGFLMSQTPCTGNLVTNNLITNIAQVAGPIATSEQFTGYINEVRIWNVARTQNDLRSFMNASLPNPTTQTGLLGYYNFNNLLNKQGNAAFNGTTSGSAIANQTNPNCSLVVDSCNIIQPAITDTTIINNYTPVLSFDPCKNIINVQDAAEFSVGDTVLLIQMKGAVIDSTNTSAFGNITDYKNAGNYEFNYIKSISGNGIELLNTITKQYDLPVGKVQLIRVPYYQNARFTSVLTCLPWDGNKGGVLVFNVQDTLELLQDIHVTGKGFKGGEGYNSGMLVTNCFTNNYYYSASGINIAAKKGESITTVSNNIIYGKGTLAGGGGGGLDHNSGGGGGGNGGPGGFGGYQLEPCGNSPFDNRGIGGRSLQYSNAANKIFMGSGGGSGHANNPANINFPPGGGNGGGIIIISAQNLKTNSYKIIAKGETPPVCPFATTNDCHDAMGGGGAGGTVLLNINGYIDNNTIEVAGGDGGNMTGGPVSSAGRIGPGGGGGGGVAWLKSAALPAAVSVNSTGGTRGVLTTDANNPWGTTAGSNGINLFNLQLPIDNILFKPNIDSVRINDSLLQCDAFDFKGLAFTNTNPIVSWQWYFGDGGTAATQNTNHTYVPGNYIPKLVVTDINGCKDSITTNVTSSFLTVNAGPDSTICNGQTVLMQGSSAGGTQFQWTPSIYLNNGAILNPTATPPAGTTVFHLTATNTQGCSQTDSLAMTVRAPALFSVNTPQPVCRNDFAQLLAQGGNTYSWQPSAGINPNIPNPSVAPQTTTTYTVLITDTVCNFSSSLSTVVTIRPLPTIDAVKSNDIDCSIATAQLSATGASQYIWSPATTLNNPVSATPIANPSVTTQYYVTGNDQFGCASTDSVTVAVGFTNNGNYLMASAFTPNNDGLNDCFGIKYWGPILELEFNIYNRWGERVFHTTNPADCWNGKFKGVEQKTDVYVYWIRAKTVCEPLLFRKGTITLIR